MGPQGPQGEQGLQGVQGIQGPAGENATQEQIAEAVENYFEENPIPGGGGGNADTEDIEKAVNAHNANANAHAGLFNNKVNVSDIVNNLTTNASNKPLSAAQGVELKKMIKDEVHIGADEPSDPNAKIWIDPNEQSPTLSFTGAVNGTWNGTEDKTINIPTIAGEPGKSITIDNIVESELNGKRSTTVTFSDDSEITINDGADGADGERGHGILKVTTAPTSYTTATGGKNPIKRMSISTIKTQANVDEVLVGDQILNSYYLYNIYYLDSTYAYMDTYQSIRGATGGSGAAGKDGKSAYQYAQDGGYAGTEAEFAAKLAEEIPQADMAQNDPTAADYVKNRTHWVETKEGVYFSGYVGLTEEESTFVGDYADFVVGQTYKVNVYGTDYECEAFEFEGIGGAIGNPEFFGGESNDMPFSALAMQGMLVIMLFGDETDVTITTEIKTVHKIPAEYIDANLLVKVTDLDGTTAVCDKSTAEIVAAQKEGRTIICEYGTFENDIGVVIYRTSACGFYTFMGVPAVEFAFNHINKAIRVQIVEIDGEPSVTVAKFTIPATSAD